MRRGIGVSAYKNRQNDQQKFAALGRELEISKLSSVRELLSEFQESLMLFAAKHRTRINSDPEFRVQFHSMCRSAGVDPLASNRGIWANLLGIGDFYFDLGVAVIEICLKTRAQNGGLIPVTDLLSRIRASAKGSSRQAVSTSDILRAVEKLSVLGSGFRILEIFGKLMVLSVPIELSKDHEEIIKEAQDTGFVTELSMTNIGWFSERFRVAIYPLLQDGLVWVDEHKGN
jgi:ESCRT-II complex subunit VPS22